MINYLNASKGTFPVRNFFFQALSLTALSNKHRTLTLTFLLILNRENSMEMLLDTPLVSSSS